MRKFLTLAAAVAMLALGSASSNAACGIERDAALAVPVGIVGGFALAGDTSIAIGGGATAIATAPLAGMAGLLAFGLYNNYCATGSMFKAAPVTFVEAVPGAGYQARDYANAAKLTHEFNVAMGYTDDAQTTKYLASAAK